jgi:ribonuclease BN (tRNA processing enzyme)
MDVTFLGVGEAFDPDEVNASVLVKAERFTLLIDCGHSVVSPLWRQSPDPNGIDAVYLTHHHGDHVLGLVPVLDRWASDGRSRAFSIFTTEQGISQLRDLFTAGFIRWDERSPFAIHFQVAQRTKAIGPFATAFAPTIHAVPNHAIRLDQGGRRFCYSGDGRPTPESRALFVGSDLLMHECYASEASPEQLYHCDLPTVRSLEGVTRTGLYHIRAGQRAKMRAAIAGEPNLFVPEAGMTIAV